MNINEITENFGNVKFLVHFCLSENIEDNRKFFSKSHIGKDEFNLKLTKSAKTFKVSNGYRKLSRLPNNVFI